MSTKRLRRQVARNATQNEGTLTKRSLRLTDLPLDTLIHIQSFVLPRDILALRKCCKVLLNASLERTVWMKAVQRVSFEYGVHFSTFPLDEMSLIELEYAATSHYRFTARLWSELGSQQPLPPISIRVLKHYPSRDGYLPSSGSFMNFTMIPGGRFLITSSDRNWIQLWDLGFSPDMLINNEALASVLVNGLDPTFEHLVQPNSDGSGIFLLTKSSQLDEIHFRIFEVSPLSASPVFFHKATFHHRRLAIDACTLTSDRFAFYSDGNIVVWNFVRDTWTIRTIQCEVEKIILSDDNVVVLEPSEFSIFKIPHLEPHTPGFEKNALSPLQTPLLRIVCSLEGAIFSSPFTCYAGSSTGPSHLYHFDVIGGDEEGKTTVSRYVLKPIPGGEYEKGMPSTIPVSIDSIKDDDIACDFPLFRSARLSDHNRILCWIDRVSLKVNLSTMPMSPPRAELRRPQTTGTLWRWSNFQREDHIYAFCPMMGRLCVLSWDREIRVLDYVLPPK